MLDDLERRQCHMNLHHEDDLQIKKTTVSTLTAVKSQLTHTDESLIDWEC